MRIVVLFLFCTISLNVYADESAIRDSISIKEVKIVTRRIFLPSNGTEVDSIKIANASAISLNKFLQENSSIQFKTYGSSGSSVMSIRGANASHSKVTWNGMDIGSPMLNMNDVSLIGMSSIDQLNLVRGGSTATDGNSALAGVLKLITNPSYEQHSYSIQGDFNSIENSNYIASVQLGSKNFSSKTNIIALFNKNKFDYNNYALQGSPLQEQLNSEYNQVAFIQSLFYRTQKNKLEFHFWYQESDRNLSPYIYNRNSRSYQLDNSLRTILKHSYEIKENLLFNSSISFTRERIRYVSRLNQGGNLIELLNTNSYFDQVQQKANLTFTHNKIRQDIGYSLIFDGAYVEDYEAYKKRIRPSIYSTSTIAGFFNFDISLSNRLELYNSKSIYANSLSFSYIKWELYGISTYLKFSKNYNIPGMNDLYWIPGGNPNLKAENSFEQELGLKIDKKANQISANLETKVYHSLVNNWILWQPSTIENGIWTPQNLAKVELQGIEFDLKFSWKINQHQLLKIESFYALTQAINRKAINLFDKSVNKQLMYIPENKSGINFIYTLNNYSISLNQHYVSFRYTSSDAISFLPSYSIMDARIQRVFNYGSHKLVTAIYIDNILNKQYESIPYQAMPARLIGINFKYELNQQKK